MTESIYQQIENFIADWHTALGCLILYSFAWKRGQRNHKYWQKVYKRNEKLRKKVGHFRKK